MERTGRHGLQVMKRSYSLAAFSDLSCAYSDDSHAKQRARLCVRAILNNDIFSRTVMLKALASCDSVRSTDCSKLLESTGYSARKHVSLGLWNSWSSFFEQHCDKHGNTVHIQRFGKVPSTTFEECPECTDACFVQEECCLGSLDTVQIEFHRAPVKVPPWAIPILAGQYLDGQKRFFARAYPPEGRKFGCDVVEGTRPEDLTFHDENGKSFSPDVIKLFVLRYPPEVYPGLVLVGPDGERTMDFTRDLTGHAAEITYTFRKRYRSDIGATSAHLTEIE